MYEISKTFEFSAAHHLLGLRDGHPCANNHGHNYVVEIVLASQELNKHGFVVDYNELKGFNEYLQFRCDHEDLNEQFDFQPSAENLARHFYLWCKARWPQVIAARVSETSKTVAEYRES